MAGNSKENKNAIYNTIKSVCGIIFPLITFPYISRVIMAENFGKVNFGSSIVGYFSLVASLGVTTYAIRECSKYREDKKALSIVSSQILSINVLSTVISYVALCVTLAFARPLENYRLLIVIQSISILFTTLGADWLNTAMEDFRYITIRTVGMQILSLVLMFLFVKEPAHYIRYAMISVIASSGANIVNIFYRRKYCRTRLTVKMNLKQHLPSILLLFSLILAQKIYCNSDITMLGLMKGDFEVGLYSTSVKIYNLINTLVASVAWVVMPQLAHNFAKRNYSEINRLLKYSMNFIIVLGLPCLIGMNVIAPQLIEVLAGKEYLKAATSLHILSIALACSFISGWIANMTMLPAGREKICLRSSIVCAVVNVILNLILIPVWGLNAAAATTAAAEFLGIMMKLPYMDKKIHIDGISEMVKAPLVGVLGIVAISMIAKKVFTSAFVITGITIAGSVIFYGLTLMLLRNEFALGFMKTSLDKRKGEK